MTFSSVLLSCAGGALLLNVIVSIGVVFSNYLSRRQKSAQLLLVWLLPLLGGVIIGLFLTVQGPSLRSHANTVGATDLDDYAANLPSSHSHEL
jgi:TRAP-type mannitol/chloroaromatic compound transport system permease small subunit